MKRLIFEQLLQEFNKNDREDVMRHANDFGVSYEIELISDVAVCDASGYGGSDEREERRIERASRYLNHEYFYDEIADRESDDFFDNDIETGEDVDELVDWWMREDPSGEFIWPSIVKHGQDLRMRNHIFVSIGYNNNDRKFKEVVVRLLNNEEFVSVFFKMIRENKDILKHLRKYLSLWELEDLDLKGRIQLFNDYVFNLEDRTENFPVGSDPGGFGPATIDLFDLFEEGEAEGEYETVFEEGKSDIDTVFFDRWSTYNDIINSRSPTNWEGTFLPNLIQIISEMMEKRITDIADADYEEFREDPIDYLENHMGVDWDEDRDDDDDDEYGAGDIESLMWQYLPNLMNKYSNVLKYEDDCSLEDGHGIEFSMDNPQYMSGLEDAFEFLDILFEDLSNQSNFSFSDETGLHTNLSYLGENGDPISADKYNLMKALLFLNHDFAGKLGDRKGSHWASDIKAKSIDDISGILRADETRTDKGREQGRENKRSVMHYLLTKRFEDLNQALSRTVLVRASRIGGKGIGFNVTHLDYGGDRIEFRYPGGPGVTASKVEEATLYYAYLVLLAADPEFKKREYLKKLVGLLNNLNFESTEKAKGLTWVKKIKKGTIFTDYSKRRKSDTINWRDLINYVIPQKVIKGHRHRGDASYNFATADDYVMLKKIDSKKKEAVFVYIVSRSGGSRPSLDAHGYPEPLNGLYLEEFSIPLKNFELDLQGGIMVPLGGGPKWSFEPGSQTSWDSFKRNASGDYTALTRAKVKFIQQVFAAVKKYPGKILLKDLTKIQNAQYDLSDRVQRIDRVLEQLKPYFEIKAQKTLNKEEVIKYARNMNKSLDFYRPYFQKVISNSRSMGPGPHHPKIETVPDIYIYPHDWDMWLKHKDKDWTDTAIVSPAHEDIRGFMNKMDVSTQQMQDIEKKNVQNMVNKILGVV